MQSIYIFSSGTLKRKSNTLVLENAQGRKHIPVENVSDIRIFGEVNLNKRLLSFLTSKGIPVHFYGYEGYYIGTYYPRESNTTGATFVKQVEYYLDSMKRLKLAREIVNGSMKSMISFLKYQSKKGFDLWNFIEKIESYFDCSESSSSISQLMGCEGNARDTYYSAFDSIISDEDFKLSKRQKRPPVNYMNTLISFGNSLLYTATLSEIFKTHLDPRVGFLHEANQRRFTLHLDIADIFKPIVVDRVIFRLINRKQIKSKHFSKITGGLKLNDEGRRIFIKEFEIRMSETIHHKRLKRNVSYRTLIRLELYKVEKHILGIENYRAFAIGSKS